MVPYFSILLVGGGLFLEARCPISQLTLACLCHLFNRLSLSEWHHKQFDQCNFLLLQTLHTIAILQVFRCLPWPLSVFWEYEAKFCCFSVYSVSNSAVSCVCGLEFSRFELCVNFLVQFSCWQNSGWTLSFLQYALSGHFFIQVCCILCAVCAILCQYVQFSVCTYKFVCSGYNLVNRTCNLVDSMYNLVYGTCI